MKSKVRELLGNKIKAALRIEEKRQKKSVKQASRLWLGRTLLEDDHRAGGRWVGSDAPHHCTYAMTGGGKFTREIALNLLKHKGGGLAFSTKQELRQLCMGFRDGPQYVFDPFGEKTNIWNPLEEIPTDHKCTRDMLNSLVEAIVIRESGPHVHFFELARKLLRSVCAYVMIADEFEDRRSLGTVFDLLTKGHAGNSKAHDPKEFEKTLLKLASCDFLAGTVRDGVAPLLQMGLRERGGVISTVSRSIDFLNSPSVRKAMTGKSDYSLRELKSKEAWVYFTVPEVMLESHRRLMRLKFSLGLWAVDEYVTPQPKGSRRQSLFVIDEAAQLGSPMPQVIEQALVIKRASFAKIWLIYQGGQQPSVSLENPDNIAASCDRSYFSIADPVSIEQVKEALGSYTEAYYEGNPGEARYSELQRDLMTETDIAEFLDKDSGYKIVVPLKGRPIRMRSFCYWDVLKKGTYGEVDY